MVVWATDKLHTRTDAYALLERAARAVWDLPALPALERLEGGKPYFPARPDCCFNLSHSAPYGLCALDSAPVGADVQTVKTTWREGLPRRVCSPEELAWLSEQPDRWRAFALLWALKEARVKYSGEGLRREIRSIAVPLPQEGESLCPFEGLWFRVYRGADWMATVCGAHEPPEELIWV